MVETLFAEGNFNEHVVFRLPTHVIDALIHGDAVKPTVEPGNSLESGEFLKGFEKDLLREVKRIVRIGNNVENHVMNPVAVTTVKQIKHAGFAGLKASDEDGIGRRVIGVNDGRHKRGKRTPTDRIDLRALGTESRCYPNRGDLVRGDLESASSPSI